MYHLSPRAASEIVATQVECIRASWVEVCDEAMLPAHQRDAFSGGQFLNPSIFE